MTIDERLSKLSEEGIMQPMLIRCGEQVFIKLDHKAILISDPSCFADCVEFLVKCYFVFRTKYPNELRLVFGLFETIMHLPISIGRSSILTEFLRTIDFQ